MLQELGAATCTCGYMYVWPCVRALRVHVAMYVHYTYKQVLRSLCLCLSLTIKHISFLGLKSCPYKEVMVPTVVS